VCQSLIMAAPAVQGSMPRLRCASPPSRTFDKGPYSSDELVNYAENNKPFFLLSVVKSDWSGWKICRMKVRLVDNVGGDL
jgi:hypothetical protein